MGTKELAVGAVVDHTESLAERSYGGRRECVGGGADLVSVEAAQVATGRDQRGMISAEWAVGIIAAVALAGVLIMVITKGPVEDALLKFVLEVIRSFSGFVR